MITVRAKRPTYLTTTTSGVYAFCISIPTDLRVRGTAVIVQRSLHTRRRAQARALARRIAFDCLVLFDVARDAGDDAIKARLPDSIRALVDEMLDAAALAAPAVVPTVDQAVAAFQAELDAMWNAPAPLVVSPEPEPVHPHVHAVLLNQVDGPTYRTRFAAFERGPVQPHRVRRWTVLRDVPSPEHSNVWRRLGILPPSEFGDLFDSL
ncbi:DUF6538 domain-containing protein [Paraburkholderia tropica]|uniref:DUF6538 domain-containing protein n=1 Tax=Paraburkholderia tropica TaxID=92647 RepID=UPI0007ED3439|nr:DUF6538 domain-containing protein [Paraburkholderia tropica]OBR53746.1 hypothetical protein A6456_12495 [Paraburkholderia tropica]